MSVCLSAGDSHTALPGIRHQFRSYPGMGAVALEMYYPVLNLDDIIRFSRGGRWDGKKLRRD
jgi:hypothetical protein